MPGRRAAGLVLLGFCALVVSPGASAQALTPQKGDATLSLTYQFADNTGHLDDRGDIVEVGSSVAHSFIPHLDYGLSDRLAVTITLPPLVATRNGHDPSPVLGTTGIDDGTTHATLVDWNLTLRYTLLDWPVVLTPYVGAVFPSHPYETIGESAPGRHLVEYLVGFWVARRLTPALPYTWIQGNYEYAFAEKVLDVPLDRSHAFLEVSQLFGPRFSGRLFGTYQKTHGGVDIGYVFSLPPDAPLFVEHDRLLADDSLRLGLGGGVALTESLSVGATFAKQVWGKNTHTGAVWTLSVGWSFSGAR
ncbi:MAG: hypothetical protein ABIQ65_18935 [Thermoanaerobaculia bacterium]